MDSTGTTINITTSTTILLALTSLGAGIFFGALRSKLLISNKENKFHYAIYAFSISVIIICTITYCQNFSGFINPFNIYGHILMLLAVAFAVVLFFFTKKYLVSKSIYTIPELNPIINEFTKKADRTEIKLFGGDLNFLGNSPTEIDSHAQYTVLRSINFNRVSILCEEPNDPTTKIRYGKLYSEIQNLELRYYKPDKADLHVRGRIITVSGASKLLMYTKHSTGHYRALETDTGNSSGALYDNIWELAWAMAAQPSVQQKKEYIQLFKGE